MTQVACTLDEHVAVLTMNSGENWLSLKLIDALLNQLDELEKETDALTLVLTSSHEKIFSNGIDLNYLLPAFKIKDMDAIRTYFDQLNRLFLRVLTYPLITIAAVSGHAFAGGAILACACDFRFMRTDRGYFCLPEIDLGLPFPPGFLAVLKKAIPMHMFEEMQYTGKRYTAEECKTHHVVSDAFHMDTLMENTLAFAKGLKKERKVVREMKLNLHRDIIHALEVEDPEYVNSDEFHAHWGTVGSLMD